MRSMPFAWVCLFVAAVLSGVLVAVLIISIQETNQRQECEAAMEWLGRSVAVCSQ